MTLGKLIGGVSRRLRADERGWAMATTIIVTTLMVSLGLATAAWVDGQIRASGRERLKESSFNLAEGALDAQMYVLGHAWPGSDPATNPMAPDYPTSCTPTSTSVLCPDSSQLAQSFNTPDYKGSPVWTTEIHDNSGSTANCSGSAPQGVSFYDDASPSSQRWDANRDCEVWVRAQATVNGRTRVIVGLVKIQLQQEDLPRSALVAGSVLTTNNGNKPIICTRLPDDPAGATCTSSSPLAGPVQVRCTDAKSTACLNYRDGQVTPDAVVTGYTGTGLSPDAVARLRQRAINEGTYYASGCPPTPAGVPGQTALGALIFVENGNCVYTNSTPSWPTAGGWNTTTHPGVLLINTGTLTLGGNQTYYGVIYALNAQGAVGCNPACPVSIEGTSAVRGGIQVGGQGAFMAGSSKVNIIFDDYAYNSLASYGAANLVQNRWREIVPRPGT